MDISRTVKKFLFVLVLVMFAVTMLPMISEEIATAIGVGGGLEGVDGATLLVLIPVVLILGVLGTTLGIDIFGGN